MKKAQVLSLLLVLAASAVHAQEALQAEGVYGDKTGCTIVATGDYGTSDSWVVVTRRYMRHHESSCEFVETIPGKFGSLFVNAICSGEGETWPATYAISNGEEGILVSPAGGEPFEVGVCEGVTAEAADKVFGE